MHVQSRIRILGLIALTWSWLSYDHYRPWVNFHAESLALLGLGLLVGAQMIDKNSPWVTPRIGLWIGAVALLPWLQLAGGLDLFAGDALMVSVYVLALWAAVCVGYGSLGSEPGAARLQRGLMHVLWVAALVSAAIGLAQWLMVQGGLAMYVVQTYAQTRAMGNVGQPNQLATLLLMGMVALTFVYQQKIIGRMGWVLAMVFMTGVLVMTGSRAGALGLLVLAVFLVWKTRHEELGISKVDVALWVLGFVFGHFLLPYLADLLLMGGGGRSLESLTQTHDRWLIWRQVAQGIAAAPWAGYGWDHTTAAQMVGALQTTGDQPVTYAHNLVLDLLAWNGLPLGLLLTGLMTYWLFTRMARTRGAAGVYAMAALLPLAVHSLLEYPFAYAYFLVAAGFLIGMVEACTPGVGAIKLKRWLSRSVFLLWTLIGVVVVMEYFAIEEDFRVVRFQNLKIGQPPADHVVSEVRVLSQMAALLKALRLQPAPGMDGQALEELRRVARRFATGPVNLRYALAMGLNGDAEGASREMRLIRGMYGEWYYRAAKFRLRELEQEKYPQLSAVETP